MKINKELLLFVNLLLGLLAAVAFVAHKFLPLLFQRTVYYCEAVVRTVMIHTSSQLGIWLTVGLIGILALALVRVVVTYVQVLQFRRKLRLSSTTPAMFASIVAQLHLTNKAFVVESQQPFAICFGIHRPQIYVSTGLLKLVTRKELTAVLLHEQYHLEHHDALTLLIASCTQMLFPFFPLFGDLVAHFRIKRELRADQFAVEGIGNARPLLKLLKKLLLCDTPPNLAFMPALAEYQTLEIRIQSLLDRPIHLKHFHLLPALISCISLLILLGLIVTPVHALESRDETQNVSAVCLHSGMCEVLCRQTQATKKYTPWVNASFID